MKFFHIKIILLIFLFSSINTQTKQIVLYKQSQNQSNKNILKLSIGNLKVNLQTTLSLTDKYSWIKSEQCKICVIKQQDKEQNMVVQSDLSKFYNNQNFQCNQTCFNNKDGEQYGLKCSQTNKNCKIIKEFSIVQQEGKVLQGKEIQIKVKDQLTHEHYDQFDIFLVEKVFQKAYHNQQQTKQNTVQQTQKDKIKKFQQIMGKYSIWGQNSIYDDNIVTLNNKHQIVIYQNISKIQKQLVQHPKNKHIQIQFQQTKQGILILSQIKLDEKITNNHPQKQKDFYEFPILPTSNGYFSIQTQNLLLPQKQFNKICKYIIDTYFSQQQNKCQYKNFTIYCQKQISIAKVEYLQLQLILNGISFNFPFSVLLKNCKKSSCQIRFGSISHFKPMQSIVKKQNFIIGSFFLDIFAAEFIEQTQNIKLYRLNNQYGKMYQPNQKFKKQNYNIFWWFLSSIFYTIWWIVKIIFYLAVFSLCINFVYHWRKILQWLIKIFQRISKRKESKQQNQLFEEQQDLQMKDTSKLIRSFKHRNKKNFFEDQQVINQLEQQSNLSQSTTA